MESENPIAIKNSMENFKTPVNNILDDLDALKGVEFESVIDRYYTRLYKPLNPKVISDHIAP